MLARGSDSRTGRPPVAEGVGLVLGAGTRVQAATEATR